MISKFFIDRPIFAAVLSIVITLAGGVAVGTLPVAMFPQIAPPTVSVDCAYPGASAQVVAETVATPIEQQVNGVENMMYMSSQCTNDGSYNLTVAFKHGVDLNLAQVLVQNRVSLAQPNLPDVIKQTGVTTRKQSPDILMAIAINSPDGRYDQLYLSNYALMHVRDELARLDGVSEVRMLGQRDYSMRIWVDPDKLAARSMTAGDVVTALRRQNLQVAAGQIGQQPMPKGQQIQIPLSTLGRLVDVEQFANIIVKATPQGRIVRMSDIARVELGAKNEDISSKVNGRPSVSLAIFQLPDANALATADTIMAKIDELKAEFPAGVDYEVRYNTTPFIRESIGEVFKTLREAIILVAVVVLLFLQNWRSAIIPLVAVPVAIIGTFAAMAALGFSINNLTLFGLVLAIGIVVDDAIVVVEAVEHHIERGMKPRDATIKAMEEVSGPVIAIGLVLTAVFVPCAFITGIVGQFFRQFALTIAVSTVISAFNSLTLSPALAALLLKPRTAGRRDAALPRPAFALLGGWAGFELLGERLEPFLKSRLPHAIEAYPGGDHWATVAVAVLAGALVGWFAGGVLDWLLRMFFKLFNSGFGVATTAYSRVVGGLLRGSVLVLVLYGGLLGLTYYYFTHTATGFIPSQDMGYLLINVQLPDSASQERTKAVMDKIENLSRQTPGVRFTQTIAGQSLLLSANGSNFGSMFVILDSFQKRLDPKNYQIKEGDTTNPLKLFGPGVLSDAEIRGKVAAVTRKDLTGEGIQQQLRDVFTRDVPEAQMTVLGPPPVRGVGRAGGFKLMIKDQGDFGSRFLQQQTELVVEKAKDKVDDKPRILNPITVFRANVPQIFVDANRVEAMAKRVGLSDLFDTMRIYLGSLYVNDFNRFDRTWQVIVQADHSFRTSMDDVKRLKVRNAAGMMVPLGAVMEVNEINGPLVLSRYNMYPAAPINGAAAPGISSGQAINIMEDACREKLADKMTFEWTELAYLELQAGDTATNIFMLAVLMVFLVLAAQYESWSMPLSIILVVPMCLLSAIIGVRYAGEDVNIFTRIGFVVLVGLASKNAILIVEFAKHRREAGETRRQAALDACKLRLRPIIMTSLAFILGVVPLIAGHGAGSEMRRTLGITVFSGMLGVTLFGIFLTPVFFVVVDWLGETRLFGSPMLRKLAAIPLAIMTLGLRHPARVVAALSNGKPGRGPDPAPRTVAPGDHQPAVPTDPIEPEPAPEADSGTTAAANGAATAPAHAEPN